MPAIAVIGSGFSGLSAAAYLSASGHDVHIFEKNETAGAGQGNLKRIAVMFLMRAQAVIGCQAFLKGFLMILDTGFRICTHWYYLTRLLKSYLPTRK